MSLEQLFKAAVRELRERNILFAVAGGLAADLYRTEPRLTMDVDLVIMTEGNGPEIAVSVLKTLGLQAGVARAADLAGGPLFSAKKNTATVPFGRESFDSNIMTESWSWLFEADKR